MRLHRFYLQNENFETLSPGDRFICKEEGVVKQLGLVLRAQIGDSVRFFNNKTEWEFEIVSISKKELICKAKREISSLIPQKQVFLVQSLVKKDKFEWIAQKATELGATDIIPVISERSEKRGLDEKRIQKIAIEAAEQSGWGRVPTVHPITTLNDALKTLIKQKMTLYALDMDGTKKIDRKNTSIALCVGPEGGWGENDRKIFEENSIKVISIGNSVLRAETAAIVGLHTFIN